MVAILKRELSSYFNSAIAYIFMAVFFAFSGLFFLFTCLFSNTSSLAGVFANMLTVIALTIPIITMKSFSEEKRQKTDQALLTSPTSLFEIVVGKFLGAFVLFAICCCIFPIYGLVVSIFTTPYWVVILCTTFGFLLMGGAFIAINVFISSLTEMQVISAIVGMGTGLAITLLGGIYQSIEIGWIAALLKSISFAVHYEDFTNGLLDLSGVVFFLSVIALFLFFTIRIFERKRWS